MEFQPSTCRSSSRIALTLVPLALAIAGFLQPAKAGDNNPFDGYSNFTTSYFLPYAEGSSFNPNNPSADVKIDVSISGASQASNTFNVDTGSRGLYAANTELGGIYTDPSTLPGAYPGQIQLTSSHRYNSGYWVPNTVLSFSVNGGNATVNSTATILVVTTLGAESGHTASYSLNATVVNAHPEVLTTGVYLNGNGTVPVITNNGTYSISLTHNATVNEQVSYANSQNPAGLIPPASNFGIGFDITGAPGGTGPVTDNRNQIYNPLINVNGMVGANPTLVAGYIVQTNGIQLGLTANDKYYAYTRLTPTGLTSTNSVPDWQTPMGQTVVFDGNGTATTNGPGSIVMDSGISQAYISAPGLSTNSPPINQMAVYLMNSEGLVGFNIDLTDAANPLNPSAEPPVMDAINPSAASTNGTYSQSSTNFPYYVNFFNTGRNVFRAFDMLYDATNGYMGLLTNAYGASLATGPNATVFFQAQSGGFPNPAIPESKPILLLLIGLPLLLPVLEAVPGFKDRFKRRR